MIWRLTAVDASFIDAFEHAGEPDQAVIDAHVARLRRPLSPQKNVGVKRYYYLLRDNPRISLCCVGRPLSSWRGLAAKLIIGTRQGIGEFPGNRDFIGMKCFQMKAEPIEWLKGGADKEFKDGAALLSEISEQIIDLPRIEESQEQIKARYEHKNQRRRR